MPETEEATPAMQPTQKRLEAAHGLELHLLEWSQRGVPLLLVHGFGNEAHVWDEVAPVLAPHYRVLAIDLRGHGDSDHDRERRYAYEDHVADLEALTAALGIDRLVLVGHSLGGRICMLFAAKHPDRMAGLVIVDAGPELDPRGTTRIRMEVAQRGRGGDGSFSDRGEYERLLSRNYPAATPAAIRRMARHELRQRPDGRLVRKADPGFVTARAALSEAELAEIERETTRQLWGALEKTTCPTLVVRGAASDVLGPDCADRMADEILTNGRLAVVPRASHSVMADNPEGFAEALAAFALG